MKVKEESVCGFVSCERHGRNHIQCCMEKSHARKKAGGPCTGMASIGPVAALVSTGPPLGLGSGLNWGWFWANQNGPNKI